MISDVIKVVRLAYVATEQAYDFVKLNRGTNGTASIRIDGQFCEKTLTSYSSTEKGEFHFFLSCRTIQ